MNKITLLIIFLFAVCGYANDDWKFDNEEEYEIKDSNAPKKTTIKEQSEAYKRMFEKIRLGIKGGFGFGSLTFGKEKTEAFARQYELGGVLTAPSFLKAGPLLLSTEFNFIIREIKDKSSTEWVHHELNGPIISMPLLLQSVLIEGRVIDKFLALEAGIVIDVHLKNSGNYDESGGSNLDHGLVLGFGLIEEKKFIGGVRMMYYPVFDKFDSSSLLLFNLNVGYLF